MAMRGIEGEGPAADGRGAVWSVAALLAAVAEALQQRVGACAVQGELGGLTRAASGHWYFTLKDESGAASMRCVMFRRAASLVDFQAREGLRVEAWGRVSVYEPRGDLQFVVEAMRLSGSGALYEEFLRRRARLEAQGLFEASRKRPLPALPRRIGVVTSPTGAVFHDIRTALARRAPHVELILYPAPVQGAAAPAGLVQALETAARRDEVDVLIVARGGGSIEDLWAFNDEAVVRAVVASPMPVISGVGHETDVTLCDLAADLRAPTPTAAAEMASPTTADLLASLAARAARAQASVAARLDREAQRLDRAALRLARPGQVLRAQLQRLDASASRLVRALRLSQEAKHRELMARADRLRTAGRRQVESQAQGLTVKVAKLQALDPTRVLERGYAWVIDASGHALTRAAAVRAGDAIQVRLHDGSFDAEVSERPGGMPERRELARRPRRRPSE